MAIRHSYLTGIFVFVFCTLGTAQQHELQPLIKILQVLEERHDIAFTYADDNIDSVFVNFPSRKYSLAEALEYLQRSTGLLFRQLNDRFVIISRGKVEAYDICGTVVYSDTQTLVAGATIQSGTATVTSNEHGYFQLRGVAEDSTVHIRFLGYRPMAIPVSEFLARPCRQIALQPHFTTLETIFVSDFLTEGIDRKVDGSLSVTAPRLGILPGLTEPDILQAIQTLPGIQSVNETISDINVRGGTNDQNLILWDDIRIFHSGHFFGLISAFNPYLTERVTLVKNGTSASAGDGVSSTIDIRTDNQLTEYFSGGAGLNLINGDALAKIPLSEKMSLHVSARRSISDVVKTPAYGQYFTRAFRGSEVINSTDADSITQRNRNFYFYDTTLKWLYDISPRDKLRLSILNVFNDIEYEESILARNNAVPRTSGLEQRNLGAGISYSRLWNDKIKTSARMYVSSYDLAAVNFDLRNDQRLIQENKVLDMGIKVDTRISLTDNIGVFTGYQFFETGVTNLDDINSPPFRRSVKKVVRSHAAFAEGDFAFGQTSIRFGVRGNYYPRFEKLIFEPRLSLNYNFLKGLYFEILGEMKNQSITQIIDLQSDFLGVEKRRWVLSDEQDIPLITSRQLSVGIYYKAETVLISVEGYYKRVNGIITSSQGFQNQYEFVRTAGDYEATGVDFLGSKSLGPVSLWMSYSNARNALEFPMLVPSTFPGNLDIRQRATAGSSFKKGSWEFSAGMNWHTGKPFTEPVSGNAVAADTILYRTPNSSRLDYYLRIDFSARYAFPISNRIKGQLGASVWNVLDKQNVLHQYYSLDDKNELTTFRQYSLGFTSNAHFRIVF